MLYLSIAEIIVALHDILDKRRSVLANLGGHTQEQWLDGVQLQPHPNADSDPGHRRNS